MNPILLTTMIRPIGLMLLIGLCLGAARLTGKLTFALMGTKVHPSQEVLMGFGVCTTILALIVMWSVIAKQP